MAKRAIIKPWGVQIDTQVKVLPDNSNAYTCAWCNGDVASPYGGIAYIAGFSDNPPSVTQWYNHEKGQFEDLNFLIVWKCPGCKNYNWSHANFRCVNLLMELRLWPKERMEEVPD